MTETTTAARRARRLQVIAATTLTAACAFGLVAPAQAAPGDSITAHPDAFGRYFVDPATAATNTTANTTPATNAVIAVLSPMLQYWTPETPATPAWDANGKFLPESVGTVTNHTVLDANIAEAARITQTRTAEQAAAAYRIDRRNQNYSAIAGLGPYAQAFIAGTNAGTTIPEPVPADASTVTYNDTGNSKGQWADSGTTYGSMVDLVNLFRNSSASTTPPKSYYNYARPFRWSTDVSVLPTLTPVKKADADALGDGGYPSGHTNAAWLASYALAYATPERFQEILTNASEIGNSRIVAGMHSPADVIGGRMQSTAIAAAVLNDPKNSALMDSARTSGKALVATTPAGTDAYSDHGSNEALYEKRLTYGLPRVGVTTLPVTVPKGAEALIASRLPYLTADQRRWVLQSTGLPSGYALLDDAEGWGRLDLFAAADGYSAFATDVTVTMNAAAGGFNATDTWRNDIDGTGALTKAGTGILTLTGSNTYTGGTTVSDGSLVAKSATSFGTGAVFVSGGSLSETVAAPVMVGGNLTVAKAGKLALTVDSASAALKISGDVNLAGTVAVSIAGGFTPADDQVLATYTGSATGIDGATLDIAGLPAGYTPKLEARGGALHLVNTTPAGGSPAVDTLVTGTPTIAGAPVAGDTLTVSPGEWGPAPVTLGYQWLRAGQAISGATSVSYTPGYADVGQQLTVRVSGTKDGYTSQSREAVASGVVVASLALSDPSVVAGGTVRATGAGFRPGESVPVVLHSAPVTLATATAAADGTFTLSLTIPTDTTSEDHTVIATGDDSGITASVALTVTAADGVVDPTAPDDSTGTDPDGATNPDGSLASTGAVIPLFVPISAAAMLALGAAFVIGRARMMRSRRAK
ncbi:phosphatase PAP2 family protein [Glaciihabitans sp. dw_435]|uniref:acid phosphatase n=1 Tax=Glaciihabitans sp. dw_435 TaxID=2720081 RepID=UPI0027DE3DA0|nr:phosphatase PAP2 family protein [Glaciihabitans sp. dw_435]